MLWTIFHAKITSSPVGVCRLLPWVERKDRQVDKTRTVESSHKYGMEVKATR